MFGSNNPPGKGSNQNESTNLKKDIFGLNKIQQAQGTSSSTTELSKFVFTLPSQSSQANRHPIPLFGQTPAAFAELNTNKTTIFGNVGSMETAPNFGFTNPAAGPSLQYQNKFIADTGKTEQTNLFITKETTFPPVFSGSMQSLFGGSNPHTLPANSSTSHVFGRPPSNTFGRTTGNVFASTQVQQPNVFGGKQVSTTSESKSVFQPYNAKRMEAKSQTEPAKSTMIFGGSSSTASNIFGGHNLSYGSKKSSNNSDLVYGNEPVSIDKERSKMPLMDVVIPMKPEAPTDSRFKKPHLNRPKLTAGLFSQALAGIRPSKLKDPRDVKKRSHSHESHAVPRRESRVASSEEINQLKSIVCHGIAPEFMSGDGLRNHFAKFGKVTKLYPNHAKGSAVVHFQTHADAANAKKYGVYLDPERLPLTIFWSSTTSSRKKQTSSKSPAKPMKMEESSEVNEELRSMAFNTNELEDQYIDSSKKEKKSPIKVKHERTTEGIQRYTQEQTDLLKSQAKTSKEKFQILDLRDRLLRTNRIKQSNIRTAKAVVGTCLDMCPEKERYLREDGGRLPYFEMAAKVNDSQEIDHRAAIKEYSRSSADQEEPLPHELRPISVLTMTMDYLVCNVMDSFEKVENSAEWYDFVWNRTRAIRKDLTQQHLCDLQSVSLVEKCARFHIHCAERLCEEDAISFDQKINNENLTKCLQTLKHFYHDLKVKNVQCPCEEEFRGYDILLNLNLGDILRQVQQLDLQIQKSQPVLFAIKVFGALNSNNYVRFFKLVRSATYLNACLLHRYFNQVRNKALYILIRAYSVHRPTYFPLQEFLYLLGFDNDNEAADFCTLHGLIVEQNHVIFDKATFDQPSTIPTPKRAIKFIESKRLSLVGEIVHSGSLPPNPAETYQPHSSFDSNGYLRTDAISAQEQETGENKVSVIDVVDAKRKDETDDDEVIIISQPAEFDINLNEMTKDLTKELFVDVTNEIINEIVHDNIENFTSLNRCLNEITERFVNDFVPMFLRDVFDAAVADYVEEENIRLRKEQEEREIRSRAILAIEDEQLNELVMTELANISNEILNEIEAEQRENVITQCSNAIVNSIIHEVTSIEIQNLSEMVHQEDVVRVRDKLKTIVSRIRLLQSRHYLHHWRRVVIKRKRQRRNLKIFPSVPGMLAHEMSASRQQHRENILLPMERLKIQQQLSRLMNLSYCSRQLEVKMKQLSLDLCSIVAPILLTTSNVMEVSKYSKQFYWKMVLSLSQSDDDENSTEISDLLISKLSSDEFCDTSNKQIDVINISHLGDNKTSIDFRVCVMKMIGVLPSATLNDAANSIMLKGTNVVLFALYCFHHTTPEFWEIQQKRLEQILILHSGNPRIFFEILVFICDQDLLPESVVVNNMNLSNLLQNDQYFICYVTNFHISSITSQIMSTVENLAKRTIFSTGLRRRSLFDFLDVMLTKYCLEPIYQNLSFRKSLGFVHQPPSVLIELFNSVVTHATNVLTSQLIRTLSWPPKELASDKTSSDDFIYSSWNDNTNLYRLFQTVNKLKLPDFQSNGDDWSDVKEAIFNYISSVTVEKISDLGLKSKVEKLLNKTEKDVERDCCIKFRISGCEPTFKSMPWTDFIQLISIYRLNSIINEKEDVYYFEDEFNIFKSPLSWKRAINNNKTQILQHRLTNLEKSATKRKTELSHADPNNPSKRNRTFSEDNTKTKRSLNQIKKFLSQLKAEKEETKLHEYQLQNAVLRSTFPLETSTPLIRSRKQSEDIQMFSHHHRTHSVDSAMQNSYYGNRLDLNEKLKQLQMDIQSEKQKNKLFDFRFQMIFPNLD